MADTPSVHVEPRENGWAVVREGNERATSVHRTQTEAAEEGRNIARRDGTEFFLHAQDGRVREHHSYEEASRSENEETAGHAAPGAQEGAHQEATGPENPLKTEHGTITIQDSVVYKISGMAAEEVDGVRMGGGTSEAVGGLLSAVPGVDSSSQSRGVSVEVGEVETAVDLTLRTEYGKSIPQLAEAVRNNVTRRIEKLVGLRVTEVNIAVTDVFFPQEEEAQQLLWDEFSRSASASSDTTEMREQRPMREVADTMEGQERTDRITEEELRVQRTEEELRAGTTEREAGEVRVRKSVRTDREQVEVPKRREEVEVERVAVEGEATEAEIGDEEIRVPVTEEEVVVEKRPVAKEEVRVRKDVVEDTEVVEEDVRREEVEVDDETERRTP